MSKLRKYIQTARMLPKAFAQAPVGTFKRRLIQPARKRAYRAKQAVQDQYLVQIDRLKGVSAGNQAFWNRRKAPDWAKVDARLQTLFDTHPEAIPEFAKLAYVTSRNPTVLINLARSALTCETMRACLLGEDLSAGSAIQQRMRQSQMGCASLVAMATILLDDTQSEAFMSAAKDSSPGLTKSFTQLIDSCGTVLAAQGGQDVRARLCKSGFRTPKKHRLIITASANAVSGLGGLFQGAEAVTVIALDDLYGRADVADQAHHANPDCPINVEHVRSRITRFSATYHRVHEDTRAVSETIIKNLKASAGQAFDFLDENSAALALADHLFFPSLRFAAFEELIHATEFDHIVIAVESGTPTAVQQDRKLCQLLSGIAGLVDDPRFEIVSPTVTQSALKVFEELIGVLARPTKAEVIPLLRQWDLNDALGLLHHQSDTMGKAMCAWPEKKTPRVLFVMTQVAAYNSSSAAYCDALSAVSNLRVAFLGGNLLSLTDQTSAYMRADQISPFPQRPHGNFDLLQHWLETFLTDQLPTLAQTDIRHVMSISLQQVVSDGLLSFISHAHLCDRWFAQLKATDHLPKVVVLTPFRSVRVAAFASIARRFQVPSIAIEPHGLNKSYARYCKVTADYYGVITTFFAQAAVTGFGMTPDRVPVIGSPRLQAPKNYDVTQATVIARKALEDHHDIDFKKAKTVLCYFSQPSDWDQVSSVWRNILDATASLDCLLLLKTHPEEPAMRVAAYLEIAKEKQASDYVVSLETDAITAIEAADLVLTGYSATAVEAALFRRPVFCVTNGDVDYPLNQHDVIGAPLFRTVQTLKDGIVAFLKDQKPYQAQAQHFLQQEPQLLDGFAPRLQALVEDIAARPSGQTIRQQADIPESLFLDGPHIVYQV